MPGTPGNKNSSRSNRLWADTIRRACAQGDGNRLRKIAEALLDKAAEGDVSAIKELGDRIDGKAIQHIEGDLTVTSILSDVSEILKSRDK